MALGTGAIWAIDIGNSSLKALRLSSARGTAEVIDFDNIQHGKILTGTGVKAAERDELVALTLRQFVQKHNLGKDDVIVSVPSQNSFARFVKLPPVEQKRIPEIVRFEAAQQIPFDINDVQWDWQLMSQPGAPEAKVGIFAIKSDVVNSVMEHYSHENINVNHVQMAPMALYNYALYDRAELARADNQAVVILNIGAENTDLVVCTRSTVWQRAVPMGGNAFTRAVADAFKLNFEKAEKLKRTATMSKYARQIIQAMKPVFTDLASEIQRSLGFYNNSNPNTKLTKIIALGGGTKMRGLLKYLQQNLQMPIERPDSFKKLAMGPGVSAAKFHQSVCDFGIVYGLGLQALGLAKIESNLLPRNVARSMAWAAKAKYFIIAACALLLVSIMCLARTTLDKVTYANNDPLRQKISGIINAVSRVNNEVKEQQGKIPALKSAIQKEFQLFKYRDVIPLLYQIILSALPNEQNNPEQKELYNAFANGGIGTILETPRKERKQIFITNMSTYFSEDLEAASFSSVDFTEGRAERRGGERARGGYVRGAPARADTRSSSKQGGKGGKKAGFVVTIVGYSPYKNIYDLLDPAGVENDESKWGLVTRMMHHKGITDANFAPAKASAETSCPFELYEKTRADNFKLEIGEVDSRGRMPVGIGIEDATIEKGSAEVLIDPMTKEIISKIALKDSRGKQKVDRLGQPIYEVNDHWFVLNAKFIWKDAPSEDVESGSNTEAPMDR